jgi:hypothetical protein
MYYDDRGKACAVEDGTDVFSDCGESADEYNPIAQGKWTFLVESSKGEGYTMNVIAPGLYSNNFFIIKTVNADGDFSSPEIEKARNAAQQCKTDRGVAGVKAIYQWNTATSTTGKFVQTLHCSDIPMRIVSKSFVREDVRSGDWGLTLRGTSYTDEDWETINFRGSASGFFCENSGAE